MLAKINIEIDIPKNLILQNSISFSLGIGATPELSLLALKKAKGLGKKRVIKFIKDF